MEKNITKFVGLRAKTYSYLTDDGSEDKKAQAHMLKIHMKQNIDF